MTVMDIGEGQVIVARKPNQSGRDFGAEDFLPRPYCRGFYRRQELWNHTAACKLKADDSQSETMPKKFRLDMVEIRGKRGRKVPIILTQEMKESVDLLNSTRAIVGIAAENPYVFARPTKQSLGHIRACDSLKMFTKECEPPLSNPEFVTGTKLRKYIATISQVLALKETEVDWLARHLGHDIRVLREYYRLHESTIEIAKVSKLLLAVDSGVEKWIGKSLSEINISATCSNLRCLSQNNTKGVLNRIGVQF